MFGQTYKKKSLLAGQRWEVRVYERLVHQLLHLWLDGDGVHDVEEDLGDGDLEKEKIEYEKESFTFSRFLVQPFLNLNIKGNNKPS